MRTRKALYASVYARIYSPEVLKRIEDHYYNRSASAAESTVTRSVILDEMFRVGKANTWEGVQEDYNAIESVFYLMWRAREKRAEAARHKADREKWAWLENETPIEF